ncbi:hypothetical protein PO124_12075 [Bacillus licheniformis]|nr:hypothetical protein [Bacillus licheniformis]
MTLVDPLLLLSSPVAYVKSGIGVRLRNGMRQKRSSEIRPIRFLSWFRQG